MSSTCVIYARQSESGGAGTDSLSLASQEQVLRARADAEGWTVVAAIREPDIRGWREVDARPGLSTALDLLTRGEARILLVWDISRVARDLRILLNLIHQLDRHGARLVSHTEPWVEDRLQLGILGSVAEYQTVQIRKHVRRAIHARVAAGAWQGRPPYGYRVEPRGGLVVVPEEAIIVREIAARIAAGESYPAIADDFNTRGVRSANGGRWYPTTIRNVACCQTYRGISWLGEIVTPEAHEAIIDEVTWDRMQARLGRRERVRRGSGPAAWLHGIARCGCGGRLYPVILSSQRRERRYHYLYLRCGAATCPQPKRSIRYPRLVAALTDRLRRDLARRLPWQQVYRAAARAYTAQHATARQDDALRARKAHLEQAIAKIDDAYFHGPLTRERWEALRATEQAALTAVEDALAALPPPPDPARYQAAEAVLRPLALEHMSPADLRAVCQALGVTVWLRDGEVQITYAPIYTAFFGGSPADTDT